MAGHELYFTVATRHWEGARARLRPTEMVAIGEIVIERTLPCSCQT